VKIAIILLQCSSRVDAILFADTPDMSGLLGSSEVVAVGTVVEEPFGVVVDLEKLIEEDLDTGTPTTNDGVALRDETAPFEDEAKLSVRLC
jgi:hypothetical protein